VPAPHRAGIVVVILVNRRAGQMQACAARCLAARPGAPLARAAVAQARARECLSRQ
jgi:hypothetical protein